MAAPKSQVQISYKKGRTEVTYESNLDATEYYIFELTRAALKDVGKFICKKFLEAYYNHFQKHTGRGGRGTKYKVWSSRNTKYPRVQIGLANSKGFYGYFQELGTHDGSIPKLGLLTHAVQDNVAEIVRIESQYLSGLSGEAARLNAKIDENDYEGEAE